MVCQLGSSFGVETDSNENQRLLMCVRTLVMGRICGSLFIGRIVSTKQHSTLLFSFSFLFFFSFLFVKVKFSFIYSSVKLVLYFAASPNDFWEYCDVILNSKTHKTVYKVIFFLSFFLFFRWICVSKFSLSTILFLSFIGRSQFI